MSQRTKGKGRLIDGWAILMMAIYVVGLVLLAIRGEQMPANIEERMEHYSKLHEATHSQILSQIKMPATLNQESRDSLLADIVANQELILKRQDDLIGDLRQESNNVLVKYSNEITIWIGALGLLGVFIPICFQFKFQNNAKDEIVKVSENAAEKVDEIRNKSEEFEKRIEWAVARIEKEFDRLHAISSLDCIRINTSLMVTPEINDHYSYLSKMWDKALDRFEKVIDNTFCDSTIRDSDRNYEDIVDCLFQISGTLYNILSQLNRSEQREVNIANDKTRELIYKLANKTYLNPPEIKQEVEEVKKKLREIHFRK